MARGLMEVINISPGQPVYVEDYRMQDLGFEWNVQNEFDYRVEYLMTNRVVMSEISSETLWGLSGWTPANSLKITILTGVLQCAVGMADIGGRRYVRTGAGAITPTGVTTDDVDYWIRAKYDTSTDTHTFVAELASASPQADTDTDKRVTLATSHWLSPNWTGTPVDKRTSNTQLTPPAVISGNAGSSPVLSLHQDGTGLGLLVTGGDVSVGDATYNQQLIVYGTSTFGITIYDDPNAYSVEMIAGAANTLKVQTIGGTAATINVATLDIVSGPDITSTGIDMNTGTITDCTSVTATTVTGTSLVAGASGITSSGAIGAPTAGDTINGIVINSGAITAASVTGTTVIAGASGISSSGAISAPTATDTINGIIISSASINTGTWNATAVSATKGGTGQTGYTIGNILYANSTTTLTKLGIGASNTVLTGGTTPSWSSTPSVAGIIASGDVLVNTNKSLSDASMIGVANLTWVPCVLSGGRHGRDYEGGYMNLDGTDIDVWWTLSLPATKGTLKLYVKGTKVRVSDQGASNYVDTTYVKGQPAVTHDTDPTDKGKGTTVATYTDNWAAAVDCSADLQTFVFLDCVNGSTEGDIVITAVSLACYYN